jgi:hypothetical protein
MKSFLPTAVSSDLEQMNNELAKMTAEQYSSCLLDQMNRSIACLNNLNLSQKAHELAELDIRLGSFFCLIFNDCLKQVFRDTDNPVSDNAAPDFKQPVFSLQFRNLIKDSPLNNPLALYSRFYPLAIFTVIYGGYENFYSKTFQPSEKAFEIETVARLKQLFDTGHGIVFDLVWLQRCSRKMESFQPLDDTDLARIAKMDNPFYLEYFAKRNKALIEKIELGKQPNSHRHETPKVADDTLFETIIKPFEGKTVIVCFWNDEKLWDYKALKSLEQVKAAYNNEVVLLCITDESLPLDIWKAKITDIDGEHYRFDDSKIKYLMHKFGDFSSFPCFMILNRKGIKESASSGFGRLDFFMKAIDESLAKEK